MIATCGRTIAVSGAISPAWFMPISNTPNGAVARHARQRQRHAPMVVVGLDRRRASGPTRARQRRSISLVAGLADAAGDARRFAPWHARAGARGRWRPAPVERVVDRDQQRPRRPALVGALRPAPRPRPLPNASATNSCPSRARPSGPRTGRPAASVRVSMETPRRGRRRCLGIAAGRRHQRRPTVHSGGQPCIWPPRGPRAPPRRSERQRPSADDLALSRGPCRRSPARRRAPAGAPPPSDRLGAVADLARPGRPARISARMVGGVLAARVVVGDDDACRPGARRCAPISGRLPLSRSPPQPNTTIKRPGA